MSAGHFDQSISVDGLTRIRLRISQDGLRNDGYAHGVELEIRKGWNKDCEMVENTLSVEELRALHDLISRAICKADRP